MSCREFFTFLSFFIFSQCGNPNADNNQGVGVLRESPKNGDTVNDDTNIFSGIVNEFQFEIEKLKIIADREERKKNLDDLIKNTEKNLLNEFAKHLIASSKRFLINPTNYDRKNEEEERVIGNICHEMFSEKSDNKTVKECIAKGMEDLSKHYEGYISPSDFPDFTIEVEKIARQVFGICGMLNGDALDCL